MKFALLFYSFNLLLHLILNLLLSENNDIGMMEEGFETKAV